jgi:hypothetical protein
MSSKRETPVVITPVHAIEAPRPMLVEPPRVVITLHLDTLGATVIVDGDTLDVDPSGDFFAIDRPAKGEMRVVLVKAPGHVDRLLVIDAATPATVEVSLAVQSEAQNEAAAPVL